MKKITIILFLLLFARCLYSQQIDSTPTLTKQDYLKKSRNQKTAAWVLGGTGIILIGTGLVVAAVDVTEEFVGIFAPEVNDGGDSGGVIALAGLVAVGCSVPLFFASDKNRKKAMSLSIKMQHLPKPQHNSLTKSSIPSLSLKIGL